MSDLSERTAGQRPESVEWPADRHQRKGRDILRDVEQGFDLGTVITTNHIRCEDEVKALLDIPEDVVTFALMPIGWPLDRFGPLTRRPLTEVIHAERWGVAWPG